MHMYLLAIGEPVEAGTKRILGEKIFETAQFLENIEQDPIEAVHESRKNMKRIRAILRLVRDAIGTDVYRKENTFFRDTARKLARMRDAEVMLETYQLELERPDIPVDFRLDGLDARLGQEISRTNRAFFNDKALQQDVLNDLREAALRIESLVFNRSGFDAIAGGIYRIYRRGKIQMLDAYRSGNEPHKFHLWRKRVKYLWHIFEALQVLDPPEAETILLDLEAVSGALGEAHDLSVLGDYVYREMGEMTLEAREAWRDLAMSLHHDRVEAIRPTAERLYAGRPGEMVAPRREIWIEKWGSF